MKLERIRTALHQFAEFLNHHKVLCSLIFALATGGIVATGYFKTFIRNQIDWYFEPYNKTQEAYHYFDSQREDDGFQALEAAINLYRRRNLSHERDELEKTLHDYVYYISISQHPEMQDVRLKYIVALFQDENVPLTSQDNLNIAWLNLASGKNNEAHTEFETIKNTASLNNQVYDEANADMGLFYCSIISGDAIGASQFLIEVAKRDRNAILQLNLSPQDPSVRRYSMIYTNFPATLKQTVSILTSADFQKKSDEAIMNSSH